MIRDVTAKERDGRGGVFPGSHDGSGNPRVRIDHNEADISNLAAGQVWELGGVLYTLLYPLDASDELPARWRVQSIRDGVGVESDIAPAALRAGRMAIPQHSAPSVGEIGPVVIALSHLGVGARLIAGATDEIMGSLTGDDADIFEVGRNALALQAAAENAAIGARQAFRAISMVARARIESVHLEVASLVSHGGTPLADILSRAPGLAHEVVTGVLQDAVIAGLVRVSIDPHGDPVFSPSSTPA